ncbi:MAG: hypothetical protein WBB28_02385 [Crinalium sp.]
MSDNNDKEHIDFRLRLRLLANTHEGVVLSYLSSQGSRASKDLILQFLRMCVLPLAYKQKGDLSDEELKIIALESCDALENRARYIRTLFGLEKPTQQTQHVVINNGQLSAQAQPLSAPEPEPEPEPEQPPKRESRIKGVGTYEEAESLFGGI